MKSYAQTFDGWTFVDLEYGHAVQLVTRLTVAGAGFACTSETSRGRRIYFTSETSTGIVKEFLDEREETTT